MIVKAEIDAGGIGRAVLRALLGVVREQVTAVVVRLGRVVRAGVPRAVRGGRAGLPVVTGLVGVPPVAVVLKEVPSDQGVGLISEIVAI